jgi:hypothetical protein
MASLTTVYIVSTVLASAGAMVAAYVTTPRAEKTESLKDLILENFKDPQITSSVADIMVEFIEKPVNQFKPEDRSEISTNLKKVYLATHPDKGQCPGKLGELCGIIFSKARSIDKFTKDEILEGDFTGNLTDQAVRILNTSQ